MLPLVITHAACNDGFWAGLVALLYYGEDQVEVLYAKYGGEAPDVTGRDVLLTDFSFPRETLIQMESVAKSFKVLDHHASAQKDLEGLQYCHFDMNHSGAVLAWKHFYPNEPTPQILLHVEDYDLWRFHYPDTKAIVQGMYTDKDSNKILEGLRSDRGQALLAHFRNLGSVVLMKTDQEVQNISKRAHRIVFGGYEIPAVNTSVHISELGDLLSKNEPFAMCYVMGSDGQHLSVSLRSQHGKEPQGVDVSVIASLYGGGGHPCAAGCRVALEDFVRMLKGGA